MVSLNFYYFLLSEYFFYLLSFFYFQLFLRAATRTYSLACHRIAVLQHLHNEKWCVRICNLYVNLSNKVYYLNNDWSLSNEGGGVFQPLKSLFWFVCLFSPFLSFIFWTMTLDIDFLTFPLNIAQVGRSMVIYVQNHIWPSCK